MDLLERFTRGDIDAFEALFRQHVEAVYGWVLRIVRERASAEDVTIEAFWRMYQARRRFDPQRAFEPWARRIATNLAFSHLRSRSRETSLEADVPDAIGADPAEEDDTGARIREAFEALPPLLRGVATLALIEERPYREIGDALGLTENAVKLRVFRAVRILRKTLTEKGVTP